MAQENERIIREQNVILEEKVQSRTEELQSTNEELKVTLDDLKATQAQLIQSEKMASLGVLTAGVAHEINNPLNYIHGGYTALNEELKKKNTDVDKDSLKEFLGWIETGVEKASRIVKSLNIYSRSNDDYTEACDVNAIIEGCLSILQQKITHQIEIEADFTCDVRTVQGNCGKLHQAILNLLSNAIDSIEDKGVIKIQTQTKDSNTFITIEDNGCGISPEDLKRIMDPFFTTKSPGEGTGLGLSIVYSILREHKGTIHFDSEEGKGTKTTVTLPTS